MIKQELIPIKTEDHVQIAVHKIAHIQNRNDEHILLTHGMFSNQKICLGVAKYLASKGFVCWILEWRNHGKSTKTTIPFSLETIAFQDLKATILYLVNELKIPSFHCVTHSGGGLSLAMLLSYETSLQIHIKSMTLVACQAFGAAQSIGQKIYLYMGKLFTFLLGFVPAKQLGLGVHKEHYFMMKPWFDWNLHEHFKSQMHDVDYRTLLPEIKTPIYFICGAGDQFIAPTDGSHLLMNAFKNSKNRLQEFSRKLGHLEDYNHSRILLSRNAAKEVWPTIHQWILKH